MAIDVLRASTTIVTALSAGAREVRPASSPGEARARLARAVAAGRSRESLLLGGEERGLRVEGFDLGNSPLEYTREVVSGKTIFFSTTNGTKTLRRAAGRGRQKASRVLVASFGNVSAVVRELLVGDKDVTLCCAGTRGGFSLEDVLLAGLIVSLLEANGRSRGAGEGAAAPACDFVFRDLARAASTLYRSLAGEDGAGLSDAILGTDHARHLASLGFRDDVAYAATRDLTDVVPEFSEGRVRAGAVSKRAFSPAHRATGPVPRPPSAPRI